jgi:hypothetical protein
VGYLKDSRVDDYIDRLPVWQREICVDFRELAHAADPELEETIKRTVQPYFVLQGNVAALLATKDHVNVFLYCGGIVPDPHGIVTGGHGNSTGRTISVYEGGSLPHEPLTEMLQAIIADNRAGGWRRITAARGRP